MLKLYSGTTTQTAFKCIAMLILVLIINDISTIYTFFTSYLSLTSSHFLSYLDDNFINEYKRITEANPSIIFCLFMQIWSVLSPFIPIYFCCFCLILKETINGFKNKFQKVHNISFNILDQTCTEIINLTDDINESFHDILLVLFIILLVSVFSYIHTILFYQPLAESVLTHCIWNSSIYFLRFVIICLFASSTSKAGLEFKKSVYTHLAQAHERWKSFLLVIKMNEGFVEF